MNIQDRTFQCLAIVVACCLTGLAPAAAAQGRKALPAAVSQAIQANRPGAETRFWFPSGHSSSSFATATVRQRHFGWKAGVTAYAMATYVASSRLQENRPSLVCQSITDGRPARRN